MPLVKTALTTPQFLLLSCFYWRERQKRNPHLFFLCQISPQLSLQYKLNNKTQFSDVLQEMRRKRNMKKSNQPKSRGHSQAQVNRVAARSIYSTDRLSKH